MAAPPLLLAFVYGPDWLAVPLLIALGLATLLTQPVLLALVQDQFPQNRALANGIYLAISFLLQAAAIWVVGSLAGFDEPDHCLCSQRLLLARVSIPAIFWLPARSVAVA